MADHIQIGDIVPRIQYTADGTQAAFTYPFPIFAASELEAYVGETLAALAVDYAVSGAGASAGGTVTFTAPPSAGATVTLRRRMTVERTSDFQESGEFRAKVINDELDRQTAFTQQVADDVQRSLRLSPTDTSSSLQLPDKATRANTFLAFDADGNAIAAVDAGAYPATPFAATILDAADAAEVLATLGGEAADPDILKADTADTLTVGFTTASYDAGTVASGSFSPAIALGQIQHLTIGGSFTLDVPSDADEGAVEIEATVDAIGGYTVTVAAGYTQVTGTIDTAANAVNVLRVVKLETKTTLEVVNLP